MKILPILQVFRFAPFYFDILHIYLCLKAIDKMDIIMRKTFLTGIGFLLMTTSAQAATDLGDIYSEFKNNLNKNYGFSYDLTYSALLQRTSPSGDANAFQSYLAPSITWTTFNNDYGTGILNASYYSIFYGNHNADDIQGNTGMVTPINDFGADEQEFADLYYTYQLPRQYNWLTFGIGQYSLYNFDGTDYDNNQQVNFLNYASAQNASATYSDAGLGAYVQATPNNWQFAAGFLDATNINAPSIRFNHLNDGHFTTFGLAGYNPTFKNLGDGQYFVMVYNQPYVHEQPQSTTGWSVNIQQNIGERWALFGRINGVSGHVADINQSYVLGGVFNNPLQRNELDQIGLSYAYNKVDEKAVGAPVFHDAEQVIEAYWAWGISKWATITPDFQFYIHPAQNQKSDYGTVTSLRLTVFF